MKEPADPQVLDAIARRLAASKRDPKIVIFGQAQQTEPPRQRSQSARAQFVEAIAKAARRHAKPAPVETMEARAQRTRNAEALAARLKYHQQFARP